MDKRKLNKVFKQIKDKVQLDYAITNADEYGDCASCVTAALHNEFGSEATGIWVKHWLKGINKGKLWKYVDSVYIAHDITEEMAKIMVQVLKDNGYKVEPEQYEATECFKISERGI